MSSTGDGRMRSTHGEDMDIQGILVSALAGSGVTLVATIAVGMVKEWRRAGMSEAEQQSNTKLLAEKLKEAKADLDRYRGDISEEMRGILTEIKGAALTIASMQAGQNVTNTVVNDTLRSLNLRCEKIEEQQRMMHETMGMISAMLRGEKRP